MRNIAVFSTDSELNAEIERECAGFGEEFHAVFLEDEQAFVQYLNYELPEIDVINYSEDPERISRAYELIKNDPWLHFGGSVIVHQEEDEQQLHERFRGVNIIALIPRSKLDPYLSRVLSVLYLNRSILFQRDIHALLQSNLSGSFVMNNDPFDAAVYSNLLANFLYNSSLLSLDAKYDFSSALNELLINAIEHGNCEISYEEKREFLTQYQDIMDLIRRKNADPRIAGRKVRLDYRITPGQSNFTVSDEGGGFDWRMHLDRETAPEDLHGRGILIARHFLKEVRYNEAGNQVSFEIPHLENEANAVPRVFENQQEVVFEDGEVVFREGERSSFLYYIVSGRFDIFSHHRKISTLTPADIFLGEMSFLLNNRRSATVVSSGRSSVLKISKESFINAIKGEPHYGIFLARMLAQRLDKLHDFTL